MFSWLLRRILPKLEIITIFGFGIFPAEAESGKNRRVPTFHRTFDLWRDPKAKRAPIDRKESLRDQESLA
jgi:hypothetical protein